MAPLRKNLVESEDSILIEKAAKELVKRKFISVFLDIDECANPNPPDCDVNAVCNNTQGSYVCTCKEGFFKDGQNCTGNLKIQLFSVKLSWKQFSSDLTNISFPANKDC